MSAIGPSLATPIDVERVFSVLLGNHWIRVVPGSFSFDGSGGYRFIDAEYRDEYVGPVQLVASYRLVSEV